MAGVRPLIQKLQSTESLKRLMAAHFAELDEASRTGSRKVAWCSSVGPAELLRALGFLVYFPENHGALLGATRRAGECIPAANAAGYSPDICSYLTSDVGAYLKGLTPLSQAYPGIASVPRPDVLVYNTNQCRDIKDWFSWYGRRLAVPCLGVETFRSVDAVTDDHVRAISAQLQALVTPLARIAGASFDPDRLAEVLSLSRQCSDLWGQVLATARHAPSPLTFFDGTIHMGPAVVARGTETACAYYRLLLAELTQRVAAGTCAVEGERHRLYWEGMPIWGRLRELAELFSSQRACVAASTYCNSWVFADFDPLDPFDSMARAYVELFIVRSDEAKERYLSTMVERYGVHGMIFHDAKTCPNNSNSRYGMPERLGARLGIPTLVLHGDVNDLRLFSDQQARTQVEAFIELVEARGA